MGQQESILRIGMTPEQRHVCDGLMDGLSNREIAKRSATSESNIKHICQRLYRSFNITSGIKRVSLARELIRYGFLGVLICSCTLIFPRTVDLSWAQSTGCTGCTLTGNKVYRSSTSGGSYSLLYSSGSPITAFTDTSPANGWNYYVVTALTATLESPYSNEVAAFLDQAPTLQGNTVFQGTAQIDFGSTAPSSPFVAYNGVDVIPTPSYLDFGGLTNNGATRFDTSFLGHTNFDGSTFSNAAFLSSVTRFTDSASSPGGFTKTCTAGQGGAGGRTLTNTDTTLVGINCNGAERVSLFNTSTGHPTAIGSGIFITTNMCVTSGFYTCPSGSSTAAQDFGALNFSQTDRSTVFSFGLTVNSPTTQTSVCPYTINPATGAYSIPTCIADFRFGLPSHNASPWATATSYGHGDYVTYQLTGANMAHGTGIWTPLTAYSLGDIVTVGGVGTNCMYKVIQAGTSNSGTGPAFLSANCDGATLTDGTMKWQGTHSTATFLYQNTGASGTSGGTFGFSGHPDLLSKITDGANIIWTNSGPSMPNPNSGWTDMGQISSDTTCGGYPSKYGMGISTNTYGDAAIGYSHYNGTQDTGFWAMEYDCTANTYRVLNTITGIWTNYNCGSGTGYTCAGITATVVGDLTAITAPPQITQPNACPNTIHAYRISKNGAFAQLTETVSNINSACNPIPSNFLIWKTDPSAFDTNNSLQYTYRGMNHSAMGVNKMVAWSAASGATSTSGMFTSIYDLNNPSLPPLFSVWLKPLANQSTPQPSPPGCYVTASSIEKSPDCNLSEVLDSHLSWVGDPGVDTGPICGTSYNYSSLGPAFNAWQNMETCYPSTPTGCQPGLVSGCASLPPNSMNSPWQFTHTFALGNNLGFSTQFQVSEYSQDGNWLFWSTDDGGTLGSTTGSPPAVWVTGTFYQKLSIAAVPANPTSLGGLPWQPNTAYVAGNVINPIEGTSGSGAIDDVFQALTSGTSGPATSGGGHQPKCGTSSCFAIAKQPLCGGLSCASNPSSTPFTQGDTICDNTSGVGDSINPALPYSSSCPSGVVWRDVGPQTTRGDVFAVKLHP